MYFAVNPPLKIISSQIADECRQISDASPWPIMHLFALVDCAFDEAFFRLRFQRGLSRRSLYADSPLQALGAAAPHLLSGPQGAAERRIWLDQLFGACDAKPMLSLIATPLSADDLARHLRPYLIAITPDNVQWPVRWGDTRVLPALMAALTEVRRGHFLAPLARWWSPGRDGGLLSWQGAATPPAPADFDKLPFTDAAFADLVDTAEADAVLANLYDSQPDLFHVDSPAECHARVARNLQVATAHGIDAAPAREQFSALALLLADDFTQQPAMAELLRRTRQGANYNDEIASLPDDFWHAAER